MRKKSKKLGVLKKVLRIGLFLVLLLGSLGWVFRSSLLTSSLEVQLAKEGSIKHIQTVSAIFANEEVLIQAPAAGKPEYLGKEGQRFRRGEPVAVMKPEGVAPGQNPSKAGVQVVAPIGGLLYHSTDGLESILTPGNLQGMDVSKVLAQKNETNGGEGIVQSGGSIGKIVNNLRSTVALIKIPTEEHKLGKSLKFIINDQTYSAKVVRLLEDPQGIVVQFPQYVEGTATQRIQEISWISRPEVSGIVVPKSALWNKGEEQGVYVVMEGILQFRKVKVLDENEQNICVEELPPGIPVVKNPRSGLEDLTIKVKIPSQS